MKYAPGESGARSIVFLSGPLSEAFFTHAPRTLIISIVLSKSPSNTFNKRPVGRTAILTCGLYAAVTLASEWGMVRTAEAAPMLSMAGAPESITHVSNDRPAGGISAVMETVVPGMYGPLPAPPLTVSVYAVSLLQVCTRIQSMR